MIQLLKSIDIYIFSRINSKKKNNNNSFMFKVMALIEHFPTEKSMFANLKRYKLFSFLLFEN